MKDNSFKMANERSLRNPAQAITNAEYANDIALLENTPTQAEFLLHSLEQASAGLGLHVKADKTEYMGFNRRGHDSVSQKYAVSSIQPIGYQVLQRWDSQ